MSRYIKLVDTPEAKVAFRAQYRISNSVEIQHCEYGEWLVINKPPKSVVIQMIAFFEGEMELPVGQLTRDYLLNFRVLKCVDMLNRKMGTNLTWHDVNWVYNCQKGEKTKYYIKCRVPAIRLISYLPDSSKGIDEDFLIISGD